MASQRVFMVLGTMVLMCLASLTTLAQQPARSFAAPEGIDYRSQTILSEGARLSAELFSLKSLEGKKLPTIIMSHGWGGLPDEAGDYRNGGSSTNLLVATGDKGVIYRVSPDGKGETFYNTDETHVISTPPKTVQAKHGLDLH